MVEKMSKHEECLPHVCILKLQTFVNRCASLKDGGYFLRNASLGDFVVVRTSYTVLTQTQTVQYSLLHT